MQTFYKKKATHVHFIIHGWWDRLEHLYMQEGDEISTANKPCSSDSPIVLPKRLIQLHTTPLPLGEVCLPKKPDDASLRATNLEEENVKRKR